MAALPLIEGNHGWMEEWVSGRVDWIWSLPGPSALTWEFVRNMTSRTSPQDYWAETLEVGLNTLCFNKPCKRFWAMVEHWSWRAIGIKGWRLEAWQAVCGKERLSSLYKKLRQRCFTQSWVWGWEARLFGDCSLQCPTKGWDSHRWP